MLPISQIKEGDYFQNPMFKDSLWWVVEEVVPSEKMVKVQGYGFNDGNPVGKPFWKKNTDRLFSESWRYLG